MNLIKGFALNRNLINNTPGIVAEIGELSPVGFTFSKEPHVYSSETYPTVSLVHFPSKGSGVGTTAVIPADQVLHILKVMGAIYDKSNSSSLFIPPGEFLQYLQAVMGGSIADVKMGGSVVAGNRSIVEWVQWTNTTAVTPNTNKVWFTNEAFEGQFDEYEHVVVPPFVPVDQFFGNPVDVKKLINKRSYQVEMEDIQIARGKTVDTLTWGSTFNYVNPLNQADKTPVKFAVLIYGAAGNNIDLIKEAIVDYLLKNSTHTRDEWKNILPELFQRREFLMYPQYKMAIENILGGVNGIYSPTVALGGAGSLVEQMVTDSFQYPAAHVRANAEAAPFSYMSIAVGMIGHIENEGIQAKMSTLFPDYFYANNLDIDFKRMSQNTQDWVLMILNMIRIARDMSTSSTVPPGYSRAIRGTKVFLSKTFDNIQYLVAAPGVVVP